MSSLPDKTTPTRVFLSYARGNDEAFVRRLHGDLTKAGFTVWFDRESLMSRGLTFHQEIKDAIRTEVDRVVYVGGPKAAISPYVHEEWQFALECDHVVVTPILRLGDYEHVPGELSLLHCEDFRDDAKYDAALAKLVASLRQPNPKLGALFAVPSLPPNFLGRPDLMRRVRDALLVDLQKPQVITGADARVGMQGMGGIGKSVLAAALARNRQVRQSYPDGVVWIACGQKLTDDDLLKRQRDLARHLGGDDKFSSLDQGKGALRQLLAAKAVLLVLDDVWRAADAQPFDVLGPRCRMLVTTRDKGILDTLHGELVPVSLFTERESLQLLAEAVNVAPAALPAEAREVARECGCLPLALALCGGMAKSGHAWSDIVEALREADLEWPENREAVEQHRTIWNAMKVSYDALPEQEKPRFAELAVFVADQAVPEAAAATLWEYTGQLSARNSSKLLINLAERSLIQLDQKTVVGGKVRRRFRLHDLLHDYAVRIAGEPRTVHQKLLDAYSRKCAHGWPTGPDDGYFLQNLVSHLLNADRLDEAVALLTDLPWVEAKCRAGLVFELQNDYRETLAVLPEAQAGREEKRLRRERITRYTSDLIAYAKAWSTRRDRKARGEQVSEPEPELPSPVVSCRMWTDEEIQEECRRITEHPTRLDRLVAFDGFVSSQCYPLLEYGKRPGFVVQHALATEPAGPVHNAADPLLREVAVTILLRRWPQDAVYNPRPALLRTLEGHSSSVESVSVTPDGRRTVSGGGGFGETLRLWDLESGQCLRTLAGHTGAVRSLSVTPDGRWAVSGSGDSTLRVWDLESGQCLRTLEGHTGRVYSVSVTPDGRRAVSGGEDKTLRVWNLESGQCLRTLEGHSKWVISVSVTPDGRWAVSGSEDKTLRVWDLEGGQCLRILEGHTAEVLSVSVTPDRRRAVSGSIDSKLRVWDLENGQCLRTFKGHKSYVMCVSVTPDGRRAVSGSWDRNLRVWDLESGQCLRILEGHTDRVYSVSVTPDGRRAVSGSWDRTLRVWDLESRKCRRTLQGQSDAVKNVGVTRDGLWEVRDGRDHTLRVWGLESGQRLGTFKGHKSWVRCFSVTPDGRRAVSGSEDKTLRVWDLESGRCLRILKGHTDGVRCFSATPDGRRAISGGDDKDLRVWDLESGQCLRTLAGHTAGFWSVSVTPDGRRAVSACGRDYMLQVWDLESGQCLRTLAGHKNLIEWVSVVPDGRRAVSGGLEAALRVWDLESGRCLRILKGHTNSVSCFSVAPDGRCAVSGSMDQTLRLWDLKSGQCLGVFPADEPVSAAASLSGRVVVGSSTGEVLILELCNLPLGPAILTAQQLPYPAASDSPRHTARCPVCGKEFAPPPAIVAAIQERSQKTEDRVQKSEASIPPSALLSHCPHCAHALIFNPFIVDLRDKAHEASLRRGLAHCGQTPSDDESTLGHLAALAVHLGKIGKSTEAADFQREHDALAAQLAAKKNS